MGRPKIKLSDLPEKWQEKSIAAYSEGAGDVEIYARILSIDYDTFSRMLEEEEAFSQTIKKGRELSQAWWEQKGREATFGGIKDFHATSYIFNMKNRFKRDWRDKVEQEVTGKDGGPVIPALNLTIKRD